MSDPTGGSKSPSEVFDDIGASIPDEPTPAASTEGATPVTEVAPEVPAAPETPDVPGQPRDDQGRFAPKPEAAPDVAAPQAATTAPQAPVPSAEVPASAPVDLSQYPVFEYRVAGQSTPFKGAIRGSDGVLFPKETVPALEARLAEAHQAHQRVSQMGRQLAESEARGKAHEAEKNHVLGALADIMADPNKFDAWALDTQGNWEKLLLQAQLKVERETGERYRTQHEEAATEQEVQALIPQLHSAAAETIRTLAGDPEFQDLAFDPAWQQDFQDGLLKTHFDRLFTEATEHEVAQGIAQQVGQTIYHPEVIQGEMRRMAGFARQQVARNKALAEAQTRNARVTAPAPTLPTAGAKPTGSPQGKVKPGLKPGMSAEEANRLVFDNIE